MLVDDEMVDEYRFPRCRRGHGQFLPLAKHVDQAGLAHVAPPYEGVFGFVVRGALAYPGTARRKFGALDNHTERVVY